MTTLNTQHGDAFDGISVVVTGAAGFIGSHIAGALLASGATVTALDTSWGPPRNHGNLRRVTADLRHTRLETLIEGADAVVHQAALPGVFPSWTRFDAYVQANILAIQRLLDAAVAVGVPRVVIASSSSVYGDRPPGPITETDPVRPISPYGVTKLAGENLALAYAARLDSALTVLALRYFTVYGPGQRSDMLIHRAIEAALTGTPIDVFGDGSHRRDFVYVGDVVQANLLALRAPVPSQPLNVGTGYDTSVREILQLVGEHTGRPVDARYRDRRSGDVHATHADIGRARRLLGYRPATDIPTGLRRQIAAQAGLLGVRLPHPAGT